MDDCVGVFITEGVQDPSYLFVGLSVQGSYFHDRFNINSSGRTGRGSGIGRFSLNGGFIWGYGWVPPSFDMVAQSLKRGVAFLGVYTQRKLGAFWV
jgi:hypothetical protein